MPVTRDKPAPYTASAVVTALIERHRSRGLPSPVDADTLARAGVQESLIPRTLHALVALDLIDEQKRPTPMFEAIRLAPEPEYKAKLVEWLNGAYADVLQFVDPAIDSPTAIRDAFRNYTPIGQQDRMVTLFTGLFRAAGIGTPTYAEKVKPKVVRAVGRAEGRAAVSARARVIRRTPPPPRWVAAAGAIPPAMAGLLASLPDPSLGWTKAERDRFVTTFESVLDFCFPLRAAAREEPLTAEGADASKVV